MMMAIDVSAIILAVIGMVSGWVTFWLDRRKRKQEVKNLEAETRQKYMDLAKMYVEEYTKNIGVNELTNEVKELKNELESVKKCACYCVDCPKRISVLE